MSTVSLIGLFSYAVVQKLPTKQKVNCHNNELSRVASRSATRGGRGNATQRQRGQEEGKREPRVITIMYSTVLPR